MKILFTFFTIFISFNIHCLAQTYQIGHKQQTFIDEKYTDENGRIKNFLKEEKGTDHKGIYKLTFFTEPYFKKMSQESFYPFIDVVFELKDNNHYHVPITLSPFGYSTYRGN